MAKHQTRLAEVLCEAYHDITKSKLKAGSAKYIVYTKFFHGLLTAELLRSRQRLQQIVKRSQEIEESIIEGIN